MTASFTTTGQQQSSPLPVPTATLNPHKVAVHGMADYCRSSARLTDALAAPNEHESARQQQPVRNRACRYFSNTGIFNFPFRLKLWEYFHWGT
jgi:hypothetical protein